jgi:1-deoxy-D-xylulose-5-phosphate reductoisomerase
MKAQMGLPDMKLPIQYALGYPERLPSKFPRFNFIDYPSLTFEKPDLKSFRNLQLAFDSMEQGGNAPCILNASNEIAVEYFLKGKIGFLEMSEVVEDALQKVSFVKTPDLETYFETDRETRQYALEKIGN